MVISGTFWVFAVGFLGGAVGEFMRWYQLRETPVLPDYARRPLYWILTTIMAVIGGGFAVLNGTEDENALMVGILGLAAPSTLKTLLALTPPDTQEAPLPPWRESRRGGAWADAWPRRVPVASIRNFLVGGPTGWKGSADRDAWETIRSSTYVEDGQIKWRQP